jgi:hypothetical protein
MSGVCEHGRLQRQCNECGLADEVREVRAQLTASEARLRKAFDAGYRVCADNTDKYGEYHGDSLEEEFASWLAAARAESGGTQE